MRFFLLLIVCLFFSFKSAASSDPVYIKSINFHKGAEALVPFFNLNESFNFSFDDLLGEETVYTYKISHFDRNWNKSNLNTTEYMSGTSQSRIENSSLSFSTLQTFVHYSIRFPNKYSKFLISGNYKIEIFDINNEKLFERKFVLYEDLATVGVEVKKTRDLNAAPYKQNVYLNIDFGDVLLQNPKKNINVVVLQNGQWYNALYNLQPQYVIGNKFTYQYDVESNFWAGNEFLYFDNSEIKQINNNVERILRNDLYEVVLRSKYPLKEMNSYTYYQDLNGSFKSRNLLRENHDTEADYAWVYFTYHLDKLPNNQQLHVVGMFNDYSLNDDSKLDFDDESNTYKKAIIIKQGFTNYKYLVTDNSGKVLEELNPDGNFYETENDYYALVYYKADADRYERVIGLGKASSNLITN